MIGDYGSGKTFFLHLAASIALEKKLVTASADLSPDRRLHGTGGQARSLYTELTRNLATRSKPEGGALGSVVERFVTSALEDARTEAVSRRGDPRPAAGASRSSSAATTSPGHRRRTGRGHDTGNEALRRTPSGGSAASSPTRTDARAALGVRTIVDDGNLYDLLKFLARFVRQAGYAGLLVCLDELVNLYKLANTRARNTNYEQILRILNDGLQGSAEGLGLLLGGTPEFLLDPRRGLYSYPALRSRLAENTFARDGLVDYTGPVLRLANLTPEDLYILLGKLRHVYAGGDPAAHRARRGLPPSWRTARSASATHTSAPRAPRSSPS